MKNHSLEAWELFLQTGKISDYMNYRQMAGPDPAYDNLIKGGGDPDAGEYPGSDAWRPRY